MYWLVIAIAILIIMFNIFGWWFIPIILVVGGALLVMSDRE